MTPPATATAADQKDFILSVEGLTVSFDGFKAVNDVLGHLHMWNHGADLSATDEQGFQDFFRAFVQAGESAYGKKKFDEALKAEDERRAHEARVAGSDRWCADQRELFSDNAAGFKLFRK